MCEYLVKEEKKLTMFNKASMMTLWVFFYLVIFSSAWSSPLKFKKPFSRCASRHRVRVQRGDESFEISHPKSSNHYCKEELLRKSASLLTTLFVGMGASRIVKAEEAPLITRADVGFINLNETIPIVTDVVWMDVAIGSSEPQRIEIELYGQIVPLTVANFKALCKDNGFQGSEFFRIIGQLSVQGGNRGQPEGTPLSKMGRFGLSATGGSFPPENYRILHGYRDAGIVSMMKDFTNKGEQDSRFFITLAPDASWADEKYSAFGRVKTGMSLINGMAIIPVVPPSNYPETRITIINSGVN